MRHSSLLTSIARRAYVALFLIFMTAPIVIVIPSAFNSAPALTFPISGFSLRWFAVAFEQQEFIQAFLTSFQIAACSTVIGVLCGVSASIALVRYNFLGRDVVLGLFLTPLIFPSVVLAVGLAMLLTNFGLTRTRTGLVVAHSIIVLPYIIRTVSASLAAVSPSLEEAAMTLGASRWQSFFKVTLPLLSPGLIAGITFSFIISFDEFTVSLFLVGHGVMTLPIEMYNYTEKSFDPTIAAISTLLILLSAGAIMIIEKTIGLGKHFEN